MDVQTVYELTKKLDQLKQDIKDGKTVFGDVKPEVTMSKVIDLNARRPNPYLEGKARCLVCKHEWVEISPVGRHAGLRCPHCEVYSGVFKGAVEPNVRLVCECGCDVYMIDRDAGPAPRCIQCGHVIDLSR